MKSLKNCNCFTWKVRIFAALFDLIHALVKRLAKPRESLPFKKSVRILLTNWANLGDVLLATSVIPAIKEQLPDCKIGFLVAKNSRIALQTCPDLDWVHEIDCWSKKEDGSIRKILAFLRFTWIEKKRIVSELKTKNYDCAIELYPIFPNTIPILWAAKIPLLIGFNSGGSSNLLDFAVNWTGNRYLPFLYGALLEKIGVRQSEVKIAMTLPKNLTGPKIKKPYFIFHPCSSLSSKEFPVAFWQTLLLFCRAQAIPVYFTGRGERERKIIEAISEEREFHLCDQLTWQELIKTIRECAGVVTVDSVPSHLAAALNIPLVVLYRKYEKIWHPESAKTIAFGKNAPIQEKEVLKVLERWSNQLRLYVS